MSDTADILVLRAEIDAKQDAIVLLRGALSDVQEHRADLRAALQALYDATGGLDGDKLDDAMMAAGRLLNSNPEADT